MSLKKTPQLVILWVTILLIGLSPVRADAFDGLSDLLNKAVKSLLKKEAPPARPMQQVLPDPPKAEVEARIERLNAYFAAKQDWVERTCDLTAEQKTEVEAVFKRLNELAQKSEEKDRNRRQHGLTDFSSVRFTVDGAASDEANGPALPQTTLEQLTSEQIEKLTAESNAREAASRAAVRDRVVNLFDDHLFFNSEQRPSIEEHVWKKLEKRHFKLYSLTPQTYYLSYESPAALLNGLAENVLSDVQTEYWSAETKPRPRYGNQNYLSFMSNDGVDGWYKSLDKQLLAQRKRLAKSAAVRVEYFRTEHDLTDQQLRHLELAGKGTVLYCIYSWKQTTTEQLRQWEERIQQQQQFAQGNFGFSVSLPAANSLDSHVLWQSTLTDMGVDPNKGDSLRKQKRQESTVQYIVALLDRELWLTTDQRDAFSELMRKKMPQSDFQPYEYMYEVYLLAVPIVRFTDAELKEILTPPQQQAWRALKGQYRVNGNHVSVSGRNIGNFSFNVPD